ncbi:MAG: hydroxyacylglutathione hydrolase family protein [Candidatus Eisenbacteria bacterium]
MIFEQIRVGGDRNFAYLIADEGARLAAVVDPAYRPELLLDRAGELGLEIRYLINTHGHADHAGGNPTILARTKALLLGGGPSGVPDRHAVALGRITLTLIHTPGHSDDSICVLVAEPGSPGKLITGDTLFVGKVGGTDYEAGARGEYDSLHRKLMALPDDTEVWPGHDVGTAPHSTIGHERRTNPFLLRNTFEEFIDLKRDWLEYKRAHGIA